MSQPIQNDSTFLYCDSNVLHDESNFHHYDSFFLQYKSAWNIMNQLFFNMSQLLILLSQLLILMSQPFFIVTHFSSSWNNLRHFNSILSCPADDFKHAVCLWNDNTQSLPIKCVRPIGSNKNVNIYTAVHNGCG